MPARRIWYANQPDSWTLDTLVPASALSPRSALLAISSNSYRYRAPCCIALGVSDTQTSQKVELSLTQTLKRSRCPHDSRTRIRLDLTAFRAILDDGCNHLRRGSPFEATSARRGLRLLPCQDLAGSMLYRGRRSVWVRGWG
jgi:hypothetical protein